MTPKSTKMLWFACKISKFFAGDLAPTPKLGRPLTLCAPALRSPSLAGSWDRYPKITLDWRRWSVVAYKMKVVPVMAAWEITDACSVLMATACTLRRSTNVQCSQRPHLASLLHLQPTILKSVCFFASMPCCMCVGVSFPSSLLVLTFWWQGFCTVPLKFNPAVPGACDAIYWSIIRILIARL